MSEAPPLRSYLVCAHWRTGSTLLCEALQATGLAGVPDEYFWTDYVKDYKALWQVETDAEYLDALKVKAATSNGVLGAKVMSGHFWLLKDLLRNGGRHPRRSLRDRLFRRKRYHHRHLESVFFGPLKYVWMRRKDKLGTAISLSMAEQTQRWHKRGGSDDEPPAKPRYDADQIRRYINLADQSECWWEKYFKTNGQQPLDVFYETLLEDYEGTIVRVLEHLDIPVPADFSLPKPSLKKQANELNVEWRERFLAENS